jgi:hypothetical protein
MAFANRCRECGRVGYTVMHFMPPPGCTKPVVEVCKRCAWYDDRYYWRFRTYAMEDFWLDDHDLSALRVWVTENPHDPGCVLSSVLPAQQRDERVALSALSNIAPQVCAVQAVPGRRPAGASASASSPT